MLSVIILLLTRPFELQHLKCWSGNWSNTLKAICQVDEARLCGSSLAVGPTALPTQMTYRIQTHNLLTRNL